MYQCVPGSSETKLWPCCPNMMGLTSYATRRGRLGKGIGPTRNPPRRQAPHGGLRRSSPAHAQSRPGKTESPRCPNRVPAQQIFVGRRHLQDLNAGDVLLDEGAARGNEPLPAQPEWRRRLVGAPVIVRGPSRQAVLISVLGIGCDCIAPLFRSNKSLVCPGETRGEAEARGGVTRSA